MKPLCLISILFFISSITFGQNSRLEITQLGIFNPEDNGQAKVYFNQDSQLKEILIGKAQAKKEIPVWKIQIYQGSGKNARAEAISTSNSFSTKYPEIGSEYLYHSPYFKVYVGKFKTRLEAESFKRKIQADYKSVWVVSEVAEIN